VLRASLAAGWIGLVGVALAACGALAPARTQPRSELVDAVMRGDLAAARGLLDHGADPDARGDHGDPAVMLAVLYGDAALVRLLLDRKADPRLGNAAGATALHWAIDDPEKVEALLAAGADPDAAARSGYTPLMLAAFRDDGGRTATRLFERGGDASRVTDGLGTMLLAAGADAETMQVLLTNRADPGARTAGGFTALHAAAVKGNVDGVRLLVDQGVDVNVRDAQGRTPIMWAAQMGSDAVVTLLLEHGANPNLRETFSGTTALMQAAASDRAGAALVTALLEAGAEVATLDDEGAAAVTWAVRRADPDITAVIRAHDATPCEDPPRVDPSRVDPSRSAVPSGAPPASPRRGVPCGDLIDRTALARVGPSNTIARALARAVPLLERSGPAFRAEASCPSCHHDALPAMAIGRARQRGVAVDDDARVREARAIVGALRPGRERFLQGIGFADVVEPAFFLAGLDAAGYPRDDMTDAMARYLALRQTRKGGWRTMMQRMPMDGSDVSFTALAIRALVRYAPPSRGADTRARVARARAYLREVDGHTTEDLTFQALGLHWTGAAPAEIAPVIGKLLAGQHADGGFAQRGTLASDAYATGQAIVALRDAGGLPARAPAIQRAVRFLLADQVPDGSWFVATRALPFQPFFDTGFPHGRSQFSSAAATSWAAMALAAAAE
jgi:ankyrin repeat protein